MVIPGAQPVSRAARARLEPVAPVGWRAGPAVTEVLLDSSGEHVVEMEAVVQGPVRPRNRFAVDEPAG